MLKKIHYAYASLKLTWR